MAIKATITRNKYGDYEVDVAEHRAGYVSRSRAFAVTWTLRGARRKARKLLANVEREDQFEKFREEIK